MIVRQTTSFLASLLALPQIIRNPTLPLGIRTATKRAGGFKAGSSDSAGKRRGVKKGGGISSLSDMRLTLGEWVRPGNIILRQKGTQWHKGENVVHLKSRADDRSISEETLRYLQRSLAGSSSIPIQRIKQKVCGSMLVSH